jgi:uncharacterized protein with GYD domain
METYILLINFTEEGIRAIEDTFSARTLIRKSLPKWRMS